MGILKKPYFRGQTVHHLDSKGRLRIPTKFREVLQNHYTDALIVTRLGECLVAYPPEVWESIESKAEGFSHVDPGKRAFMRYYISSASECEFDSHGRILIPSFLRKEAKLDQEVLLAGMLKSFEIWDKATWESHTDWDQEQFRRIMEDIANTGL